MFYSFQCFSQYFSQSMFFLFIVQGAYKWRMDKITYQQVFMINENIN